MHLQLLLLVVVMVHLLLLLHTLLLLLLLLLRVVTVDELVGNCRNGRQWLEWSQSGVGTGTGPTGRSSTACEGGRMRRHPRRRSSSTSSATVVSGAGQRLKRLVAGLGVEGPVVGRVQHGQSARWAQFARTEEAGIGRTQWRIDRRMVLLVVLLLTRMLMVRVVLLLMLLVLLLVMVRMMVVRMN